MQRYKTNDQPREDEKTSEKTPSSAGGVDFARGRELYYDVVAERVAERAGRNPQIKGHVQEQMLCDRMNSNPAMRAKGLRAQPTRSTTAQTADVVVIRPGKRGVVERIQVKDVASDGGARHLGRQLQEGRYNRATVKASPETIKQLRKSGIEPSKPIESTCISSDTTTRVATRTRAEVRGNGVAKAVARDISRASGGAALLSAGIHVVSGVAAGDRDRGRIALGALYASGETAAKTAGALGVRQGTMAAAEKVGSETLKKVVRGSGATTFVFAAVEQVADTARLGVGKIDRGEYARRTGANVGGSAAAYGGAMLGTALLPGFGTVLGGLVGGLVGSLVGRGFVEGWQEA
jgi:hypothetical protein